jgi:hypothetical protein
MASFTLIRELCEVIRDKGVKRLMLGLYQVEDSDRSSRYLALSEQSRQDDSSEWVSSKRGITVRKGEVAAVIAALQSADFDANPDNKNLSNQAYSLTLDWS